MKSLRTLLALTLLVAPMLGASQAEAQVTYSMAMTGKIISTRGTFIRIPIIGETGGNCDYLTQGLRQDLTMMTQATPPLTPGDQGLVAAPNGCVSAIPSATATVTALGTGKQLTIPPYQFFKAKPYQTVAVSVPMNTNLIQLATSFQIQAPPSSVPLTGSSAPGGTMWTGSGGDPGNLAQDRVFRAGAWTSQTGRAGANFTWCVGNAGCTQVNQGPNLMIKYLGAGPGFSGTMSYIITTGTNRSSLALAAPPAIALLGLAGMGQQATGRGYADYLTDMIMTGPEWAGYATGTVYVPEIMMTQMLITKVFPPVVDGGGVVTAALNYVWGFPWTTRTVVARVTGTTGAVAMNPNTETLTGMGKDTTSGGARNLTLVAGQLSQTSLGTNSSGLGFLGLSLVPEPGRASQLLAGVLALMGISLWRGRRSG